MALSLPPELQQFAERQIASGRYTSLDEVLLAGLQALVEREQLYQGRFEELRHDILLGAAQAEQGLLLNTSEEISAIRQRLRQRHDEPLSTHRADILAALERLIDVIAQLRHPETGCPWDLAQTPTSLIPYVIEEAYEVVDAIQGGDQEAIAEELGDLLLQVVLQAQVASDSGDFDLGTVATGIADKMVRRHPHVFADTSATTPAEVNQNWDRIKAEEKGIAHEPNKLTPKLTKYSRTLPPLMAASKISVKAAKAGFEWDNIASVWDKFHEELDEFRAALANEPKENQQAELGDLLFTLVNLARWYDLDPSEALQSTNRRFIQRFALVEGVAEKPLDEYSIEELEALWQRAKAQLAES